MSADFSLGDLTSGEPPEYDPANPEAWYEYYKDVLDTAYQPDYPELRDAGQEPDAKGDAEIVKRAGILPPSMLKPSPADDHLIGQTIEGRYRIISRLDAGGMGTAYRSWDERVGVPVVIKIPNRRFLQDGRFAERFYREIRLLQGLPHPHIVPIVAVGEHAGLPYVAMRFLPGGSLSNRRLRDERGQVRPNPPGMLHLWLPAVAAALDFVHANGVVHRDVKPANIFFDAFWGAFLGDFGIAKIVEESEVFDREQTLTAANMGIGTQWYMSPEQFTPKAIIDGRADQYALAVMVYEMLAGVRPFTGKTAHLIIEVTTRPAPPLRAACPGVPESVAYAVHRGLEKRPEQRFATCAEFAAAVLRDVVPIADDPDVARLLCPQCGNLLKLPTAAAGRKGKCPKCHTQMKVADDLGALWLLEEARRQRRAGRLQEVNDAPQDFFAVDGPTVDEGLEDFKLVSSTTPIEKAAHRRRRPWPMVAVWGGLATALIAAAIWWSGAPHPKKVTKVSGNERPRVAAEEGISRAVTRTPVRPDPRTLSPYGHMVGKSLVFSVLGATGQGGIWGSNPYTADSLLAVAVVHAGVVRAGERRFVKVTVMPGERSYTGSTRNGVSTGSWGAYGLSYRVDGPVPQMSSQQWHEQEVESIGSNCGSIPSTGEAIRSTEELHAGQVLQVKWDTRWWGARVLQVMPGDQVRIRYLGWSPAHDTVVGLDKLQRDDAAELQARRRMVQRPPR